MTRLPQPGKDAGQWGDILNDYLSQSHNTDGTLKDNVVGASQLQDNAVTDATIAPGAITKATVGLANVDNTADNAKPVSTVQQAALDLKADTSTLATKLNTSDLDAQTAAKITTDGTATQAALSSTYGRVGAGVARFIARAAAGATLKVVGMGDSIMIGTGATLGVDDLLTVTLTGLQARFGSAVITQSNRAVSGSTTATAGITGQVASAIADAGDLYVICFGRNDVSADDTTWAGAPVQGYARARSLRYLEVMVRTIRDRVPQADIMLLTENPAASYSSDTNMRTYQDGVRQIAATYGCELADTYAAYGASGYSALLSDGVHPSVAGHQVYANTILARIPATLAEAAAGKAAAALSKGLRTPEGVDVNVGTFGWTVVNGSAPTSAYTQTGTGWTTSYPRETATASDYMEVVFTGTDFGIRVDQSATAAPVVDIAIDGVTTWTNQSLALVPTTYQLYQFLATGLSAAQHTIRITLKSGTLRWYQMAWLAGPAATGLGTPGGLRRMVSGRYYSNPHDQLATTISYLSAGDMYVMPLWVPTATSFTKIAANVTTAAASSTLTLGVYDSNEYDQPRTLLFSSSALSSASTGWKEETISQTLQPGMYWVALLALGGAPRVNGTTQPHPAVSSSSGTLANPLTGYVATGASALPTTWVATAAAASAPMVALKAA